MALQSSFNQTNKDDTILDTEVLNEDDRQFKTEDFDLNDNSNSSHENTSNNNINQQEDLNENTLNENKSDRDERIAQIIDQFKTGLNSIASSKPVITVRQTTAEGINRLDQYTAPMREKVSESIAPVKEKMQPGIQTFNEGFNKFVEFGNKTGEQIADHTSRGVHWTKEKYDLNVKPTIDESIKPKLHSFGSTVSFGASRARLSFQEGFSSTKKRFSELNIPSRASFMMSNNNASNRENSESTDSSWFSNSNLTTDSKSSENQN